MTAPRPRPFKPGLKAWVRDVKPYFLPSELTHNEEVTTVAHLGWDIVVRRADGTEVPLPNIHVDYGWEYWIKGRYYDESTPEAAAHFRGQLAYFRNSPEHPEMPGSKEYCVSVMEWRLRRNGHPIEIESPNRDR